jgi:putative transposase
MVSTVGHKPKQVTTDKHDSYPKAIRKILGKKVKHHTSKYKNNVIEQDHRAIKQRYYPMRGFKNFDNAALFFKPDYPGKGRAVGSAPEPFNRSAAFKG